jgi:hypothetical protein
MISDTYLSVGTPVQRALPQWLPKASVIQSEIRERCQNNLKVLERILENCFGVRVFKPQGEV